ncbi:TetR family transcriptional regulator [Streptomyces griseoviridis]|uniref:TetR family transcriptional regulator n=1 Tax=Streptomyces griseoviridis TaxID=45398 RepID=A0A3Q9KSY1_STRGD|nr:TetR/AcrR family transcriptional regulator C-terminal domain-containing protein [Streptomyces griseoviridis]AZS86502.1 TetR family transcriptional regulator [Streptomyces griseoviridis]QCN86634.1 TetR family transcriptional regulator [Streptomyces griseoviridis]
MNLIWERPEPRGRTAAPTDRGRIVAASAALADAEGLAGLSMRKVAAELSVSPMRLYGYVATKDELLDLMADFVYGEIADALDDRAGWEEALRAIAVATRDRALRHAWFVELIGGRPHLGPNALTVMEATAAALARALGPEDGDRLMAALGVFNAYLIGTVRNEVTERRLDRVGGTDEKRWRESVGDYLGRQLATGRFPTMERVLVDGPGAETDETFAAEVGIIIRGLTAPGERRGPTRAE